MPLLLQSADQQKHEQPFIRVFYGLSVVIRQVQGQHGQCGVRISLPLSTGLGEAFPDRLHWSRGEKGAFKFLVL
jgi:hypothetical protein